MYTQPSDSSVDRVRDMLRNMTIKMELILFDKSVDPSLLAVCACTLCPEGLQPEGTYCCAALWQYKLQQTGEDLKGGIEEVHGEEKKSCITTHSHFKDNILDEKVSTTVHRTTIVTDDSFSVWQTL